MEQIVITNSDFKHPWLNFSEVVERFDEVSSALLTEKRRVSALFKSHNAFINNDKPWLTAGLFGELDYDG